MNVSIRLRSLDYLVKNYRIFKYVELPALTTLSVNSTSLRTVDDFYLSGMNRNSYVSDRFTYVDYYYFWRKCYV